MSFEISNIYNFIFIKIKLYFSFDIWGFAPAPTSFIGIKEAKELHFIKLLTYTLYIFQTCKAKTLVLFAAGKRTRKILKNNNIRIYQASDKATSIILVKVFSLCSGVVASPVIKESDIVTIQRAFTPA